MTKHALNLIKTHLKHWTTYPLILIATTLSSTTQATVFTCDTDTSPTPSIVRLAPEAMVPFASIQHGDRLGLWSIDVPIICTGGNSPTDRFSVSIQSPNQLDTLTGSGGTICILEGFNKEVGIRIYDDNRRPILCNNLKNAVNTRIFSAIAKNKEDDRNFRTPIAIELIKLKNYHSSTPLPPGTHNINPSQLFTLVAHSNNKEIPNWGHFQSGASVILVSNCLIARKVIPVNFGPTSLNELANSERPFSIGLNSCQSEQDAKQFNDLMSLSFISPEGLINASDGTLRLKQCDNCPAGVAIEVMNGNGRAIDLNSPYRLKDGTFNLTSSTIEHAFRARLIPTGEPVKPGSFNHALVFQVTAM